LTKTSKKDIVTSNKGDKMSETTAERQRAYKERLYKAGFKQTMVWVKRKEAKMPEKISIANFVKQLKELTAGLSEEALTQLLKLLIKIAKGKKEEAKLKKKK
jgi:G:T-mismatch repair DNA endonuclease (very short patch repair protein)